MHQVPDQPGFGVARSGPRCSRTRQRTRHRDDRHRRREVRPDDCFGCARLRRWLPNCVGSTGRPCRWVGASIALRRRGLSLFQAGSFRGRERL